MESKTPNKLVSTQASNQDVDPPESEVPGDRVIQLAKISTISSWQSIEGGQIVKPCSFVEWSSRERKFPPNLTLYFTKGNEMTNEG